MVDRLQERVTFPPAVSYLPERDKRTLLFSLFLFEFNWIFYLGLRATAMGLIS